MHNKVEFYMKPPRGKPRGIVSGYITKYLPLVRLTPYKVRGKPRGIKPVKIKTALPALKSLFSQSLYLKNHLALFLYSLNNLPYLLDPLFFLLAVQ